jgi:hypothetical protein
MVDGLTAKYVGLSPAIFVCAYHSEPPLTCSPPEIRAIRMTQLVKSRVELPPVWDCRVAFAMPSLREPSHPIPPRASGGSWPGYTSLPCQPLQQPGLAPAPPRGSFTAVPSRSFCQPASQPTLPPPFPQISSKSPWTPMQCKLTRGTRLPGVHNY